MPEGLEDLMEKPLAMTNNAIAALTKKAAATFWGQFKRLLSTASEPLLRKNMGERYLSAASGGLIIWIAATALALFWPDVRSVGAVLDATTSFHRLGHLMNNIVPTILVGGVLVYFHSRFSAENARLMAKYRDDGTPYHTQSHGVPRWEEAPFMPLVIIGALLSRLARRNPVCHFLRHERQDCQ